MALKENYKDDILDTSQNVKRKYRMTENQDGTVSFDDETVYTQEGDSFGASDMNATNGKVNALETDIDEINDNLSGFKYYPIGTAIVGLVADDTPYTDADGNYILADSATGRGMIDNITYKSISSTEKTCGEVGADTALPFSGKVKPTLNMLTITNLRYDGNNKYTVIKSLDAEFTKIVMIVCNHSNYGNIYKNNSLFTNFENIFKPASPADAKDWLIKFDAEIGDKFEVTKPQYDGYNCFVLASNTDLEVVDSREMSTSGSVTFTANKDFDVLHVFVNRTGAVPLTMQSYSSRLTAHPTAYRPSNNASSSLIYTFYNVKQGDTITFNNPYTQYGSYCIFAPK